jgi:glutathione S-transferase
LFGSTTLERARIEMWNRRMELELMRAQVDHFLHTNPFWTGRREQVAAYGQVAHDKAEDIMGWLNDELEGREFIGGPRYSVADITTQCSILLGKHTGTPIPPGLKYLERWWISMSSRPSARA